MNERTASNLANDLRPIASYAQPNANAALLAAAAELERLDALLNTPHTAEFLEAVKLEALHQRERWGSEHDAGKTDADWFWLLGYLAGKALHAGKNVEIAEQWSSVDERAANVEPSAEKRLHHIVTAAAALLNWHAARTGADTRMRPGIAAP